MIKGLLGTQGIKVSGGDTSVPYINQNTINPMTGMVRVWGSDMQVFDGTSWLNMNSSYATVSLDQETQDLILWAKAQRQLALNRMTIAQNNPALQKAYEAVQRAEENFDILQRIVTGEAIG